jgi:curved DNA-binding protein CbpA
MAMREDPYRILEVRYGADEEELRAAYRRLARKHHPDHNGGSPEAARRFEAVHEAYAEILRRREAARPAPADPEEDDRLTQRLAELEAELRRARRRRRPRNSEPGTSGLPPDVGDLLTGLDGLASMLDGRDRNRRR